MGKAPTGPLQNLQPIVILHPLNPTQPLLDPPTPAQSTLCGNAFPTQSPRISPRPLITIARAFGPFSVHIRSILGA
eukprot:5438793-Alexandrium_andersonii.AAC.1